MATFVWPEHSLMVNTLGAGNVTLDPLPGPGGNYPGGTIVTLTAAAQSGWHFSSWGGDISGTTNPTTVTMEANKNVIATFVQNEAGIEVQVSASAASVTVGSTLTYTYVVANVGDAILNDVVVIDDRLGPVPLDTSTLASGESQVKMLTYTAGTSDLPGPLVNNVTASAKTVLEQGVSDSATISVTVVPLPVAYYIPLLNGRPESAVTLQDKNTGTTDSMNLDVVASRISPRYLLRR